MSNTRLCNAPQSKPLYSVSVKSNDGKTIEMAHPAYVRSLLAMMNQAAVNGGAACHWGGPSAMVEINCALHSIMFKHEKWFENYNFVNDIGHAENGIYALRAILGYGDLTLESLKGFRSIDSNLTGHGESHLYPEGVLLSNGPLGSSLGQAQGLSIADKINNLSRTTIVTISDGACMEGEAKEAFASIAGLRIKEKMNPFVMIVSDNNTKLSGRISEDSFSMEGTLAGLKELGWEELVLEDGHDLTQCYEVLSKAIELSQKSRPVFVWAKTVKGKAIAATEKSASGGHGYPLSAYSPDLKVFIEELLGEIPNEFESWLAELAHKPEITKASDIPREKAQAGLARGAIKAYKEGVPVYSISSDLQGSTGIKAFQTEFPDRYIDIGIAESNMVSIAAGLSKQGLVPIVDTFAAFGVTKGNLPLVMASLSECPIVAIFSHIGFQDAADGASHQSLTYISAISSIPNVKTYCVATSEEGEALMYQALKDIRDKKEKNEVASSHIFFVGRENFPKSLEGNSNKIGQASVVREGKDGVICSFGATLFQALTAAEKLAAQGHDYTVINHSSLNSIDTEFYKDILGKNKNKLLTVEDHQIQLGFGAMLVHKLKINNVDFQLQALGVNEKFGRSAYKASELYKMYGVDAEAIVAAISKFN